MWPSARRTVLAGSLLAVCLCPALAAHGQANSSRGLGFVLGATTFPFSESGKGGLVLGVSYETPLGRYVVAEGGVRSVRFERLNGEAFHLLVPELSLQAQLRLNLWRPYLGVGLGFVAPTDSGEETAFGPHLAVGARVDMWERVGARFEARGRANPEGFAVSLEVVGGLTLRL